MLKNTERFEHTITNSEIVQDFPIDVSMYSDHNNIIIVRMLLLLKFEIFKNYFQVLKAMAHDSSQPTKGPWTITCHPYIHKQFMAYCPDRSLRFNAYFADVNR